VIVPRRRDSAGIGEDRRMGLSCMEPDESVGPLPTSASATTRCIAGRDRCETPIVAEDARLQSSSTPIADGGIATTSLSGDRSSCASSAVGTSREARVGLSQHDCRHEPARRFDVLPSVSASTRLPRARSGARTPGSELRSRRTGLPQTRRPRVLQI